MKIIRTAVVSLSCVFVALTAFIFLVVLPEYCACKNFYTDKSELTTADGFDCLPENTELTFTLLKIIFIILLFLAIAILVLTIILRKNKKV